MARKAGQVLKPMTEESDPAILRDGRSIRVRAIRDGYYNHGRRREGDVFSIYERHFRPRDIESQKPLKMKQLEAQIAAAEAKNDANRYAALQSLKESAVADENGEVLVTLTCEQQFSPRWMEIVPEDTPEMVTTAQEAIDKSNADLRQERRRARAS